MIRPRLQSRYAGVTVAAALGIIASLGAFLLVLGWEYQVATLNFRTDAKSFFSRINNEFGDVGALLSTAGAYLGTSTHPVTRDEFEQFSGVLLRRMVGLRDIVWCPRVANKNRNAFERAARAAHISSNYRIVQFDATGHRIIAGSRPQYYPVLYVEDAARSRALGIDELGDPVRATAALHAIHSRQPAAAIPVYVPLVNRPHGAILGYLAVEEPRANGSAAERPIKGLVLGVFDIGPMIEHLVAQAGLSEGLDLAIFSRNDPMTGRVLYWRRSSAAASEDLSPARLRDGLHLQSSVEMFDQQWAGIITPEQPPRFFHWSGRAGAALAAGLTLTLLLVIGLLSWIRQSLRLERLDERITLMASNDALTGLANRVLFQERLDDAVARGANTAPFALLSLDLDHFKAVNDSMGHAVGDQLLCAVAERITHCLRGVDLAARVGGDEFAIILHDAADPVEIGAVANRLIREISTPYIIDAQLVKIGASVGIAIADPTLKLKSGADLMQEAEFALYEAKRSGREVYCFFERHLRTRIEARHLFENQLRHALKHDEIVVYYQPIIDIGAQRVAGFEALVRWVHPQRGIVAPDQFIPLAEELGLIVPLSLVILSQACEDAARWPQPVSVAVNISPLHLASDGLLETIEQCLATSGLAPHRLEIEITEAAVLEQRSATLATLDALRGLGVRIAFDDFGTGFSSLSSLLRFPFDKIKIDKSFVGDSETSLRAAAIVRAIAGLGTNLGLTITGEGVETPDQLEHLRRCGCTQAQGYLFSPARPNGEVPRLIADLNAGLQHARAAIAMERR